MIEEPLISVIIPVFNMERYLSACLDSILSQSYKNLEIIIINDGSTDFSLKIAETYAEKEDRIKVYSYPNEGLSEARNRGLKLATGDYVAFVDADDILLPNALQQLEKFITKEKADIVEGKIIHKKFYKISKPPVKPIYKNFTPQGAIADVLYQKKLLPSVCGKLFKRELFDDLMFEKGIIYEDMNIFYKIIEKCNKITYINFPVYFYRTTEGSIINTWKPKRLDVLKVTENIENYISERYPALSPAAKDRRLSANFNMFALCSIHGDHINASKCWEYIKHNRKRSLYNPNVRLKNKTGIILSYLGKQIFKLVAKGVYK